MIVKAYLQRQCQTLDRIDVELLICRALGVPRSWLLGHDLDELSPAQQARCDALIERRRLGEPVAHILGEREFWDFTLAINATTLIPRPDTEVLVEAALALKPNASMIADLGTGTGAVAIALARELPNATVLAGEYSGDAAQLAQQNIAANAAHRVHLWQGSWLDAIADESLDMVVSNPPYIDAEDHHLFEGDVRFEPSSALVAEKAGLADIMCIAKQAQSVLKADGWLAVEHGWDQEHSVAQIFAKFGYLNIRCQYDYGGNPRVTLGQKAC